VVRWPAGKPNAGRALQPSPSSVGRFYLSVGEGEGDDSELVERAALIARRCLNRTNSSILSSSARELVRIHRLGVRTVRRTAFKRFRPSSLACPLSTVMVSAAFMLQRTLRITADMARLKGVLDHPNTAERTGKLFFNVAQNQSAKYDWQRD